MLEKGEKRREKGAVEKGEKRKEKGKGEEGSGVKRRWWTEKIGKKKMEEKNGKLDILSTVK